MSKDSFLRGALILTMAGIIVKVIGSVNRILLSRLLGGEGIGLYQMAYPIYLLALSISSAGIPIAISIMVAEKIALNDYRGANRVFRISFVLLAITGLAFSILLFFGSSWLIDAQFIRDPRAYYAIVALAPAIFFVTLLSSFRGYFQGMQMMTPTAVSQIAEQLLRVITMILFAYWLLPHGVEFAAAGASFGAGPGAVAGLVILIYFYWRHRPQIQYNIDHQPDIKQESVVSIIRRMILLALPVSLANIMLPVVSNIDLFIVPARLEAAGYSVEQATELFGYLNGMAMPLVNMATILTASLAASLIPAVSAAFTLRDHAAIKQRTSTAMRIANLITIPASTGLYLLANPISQMLYGTQNAGPAIAVMAVGIFLLGVHQVTTGVLQGLGHTAIPVVNMAISAVFKTGLNWVLTAIPAFGIMGAAWATNADFGIAALLNIYFVYRYVGFGIGVKDITKIVLATTVMGASVLLVYDFIMHSLTNNTLATVAAIVSGAGVYGLLILLVGGISVNDVERIPRVGGRIAKLIRYFGVSRR